MRLPARWVVRPEPDAGEVRGLAGALHRARGSIVNITSISGLRASTLRTAYGTSKAGLAHLTKQQAAELASLNIRVNAVLPGLVKTDFARKLWEDPAEEERVKTRFPLARLGEPEDIGPAAVFLASEASAWMTGQTLVLDGGATALPIGVEG